MIFSKHFVKNWQRRVGSFPTVATVRAVIKQSIVVQRGRLIRTDTGTKFNTLNIYWSPDFDMILTSDHTSGVMVSVLTRDTNKWSAEHVL